MLILGPFQKVSQRLTEPVFYPWSRGKFQGPNSGNQALGRWPVSYTHLRWDRRILLGGHETDVVQLQPMLLNGLLDQVAVAVAEVLKIRRGHAHIQRAVGYMAVTACLLYTSRCV